MENLCSPNWSDLSVGIFAQVAERLSYFDLFRFGAVCKSWRALVLSGIECRISTRFLIRYCSYYDQETVLELVDLLSMRFHRLGNPICQGHELFGARFHASKFGWLLFSKPSTPNSSHGWFDWFPFSKSQQKHGSDRATFFFYNPFGTRIMELPSLNTDTISEEDVRDSTVAATFSTTPASDDCVIFVILYKKTSQEFTICTCNLKEKGWIMHNYPRPADDGEVATLVYLDGIFHCVIHSGSRIVFASYNIALEDWVVKGYSVFLFLSICYLVESCGELLFAFRGRDYSTDEHDQEFYWHFYKFNRSRRDWTRVLSLGDRVLLLYGKSSSIFTSPAVGETREIAGMVFDLDYEWNSCSAMYYPTKISKCRCEEVYPSYLKRNMLDIVRGMDPKSFVVYFS